MPLVDVPKNLIDLPLRNRLLEGDTREHLQGCGGQFSDPSRSTRCPLRNKRAQLLTLDLARENLRDPVGEPNLQPKASNCGPASKMAVMSWTADIEATARFSESFSSTKNSLKRSRSVSKVYGLPVANKICTTARTAWALMAAWPPLFFFALEAGAFMTSLTPFSPPPWPRRRSLRRPVNRGRPLPREGARGRYACIGRWSPPLPRCAPADPRSVAPTRETGRP